MQNLVRFYTTSDLIANILGMSQDRYPATCAR